MCLVSKYAYQALHLRHHGSKGGTVEANSIGATSPSFVVGCLGSLHGSRLSYHSLKHRLHFITERFASHAPHWQFVIWGRQLALTAITLVPELVGKVDELDEDRCAASLLLDTKRLYLPLLGASIAHTMRSTISDASHGFTTCIPI